MKKEKDEIVIYWYHEFKEYIVVIKNKITEETVSSIFNMYTGIVNVHVHHRVILLSVII